MTVELELGTDCLLAGQFITRLTGHMITFLVPRHEPVLGRATVVQPKKAIVRDAEPEYFDRWLARSG